MLIIEALTDIGRVRKINEDTYGFYTCTEYSYAIVCDGMGGHLAGEVASELAVSTISEYIKSNLTVDLDKFQTKEVINRAFKLANSKIYDYSCNNESVMGMGTTATLILLRGGYLTFAHVGDSRAYMIDKKLVQLTKDHSYVQELVKLGQITPEEAKHHPRRNIITRAMGIEEDVKVDMGIKAYNAENVLICSDGLYEDIEDEELFEIVTDNSQKDSVDLLVKLANERGGKDNITALIIKGE